MKHSQQISAAVKAVHLLQKTYSRSDIDQRKVWVGSSDMIFPQTFQSAEDGSDTALEEEDKVPNSRPQVKLSDSDIAAQHALINS